jgi:hypothetical protein
MKILQRQLMAQAARLRAEADQLEALADAVSQSEEQAAPTGCMHPEDQRIPCPAMSMPNRWLCGLCNYAGGV